MTAPTHIAFGAACAVLLGIEKNILPLVAGGALLPDIDHPQSAIGRVFFFLSFPLHRIFGHRGFVHSLVLWMPLCLIGYILYIPVMYIALGAITHVIIDSWNLSGVQMMAPISEQIFVLAKKNYRFASGSRQEFMLLGVLIVVAYGVLHLSSHGGMRAMLQSLLGNYDMAREQYLREDTKVCYIEGTLRRPNGNTEKGRWLVIGTEGENGMAIFNERTYEIIHVPKGGLLTKAILKPQQDRWQALRLREPTRLQDGTAFYMPYKLWHTAKQGDIVAGYIIHLGPVTFSAPDA